MEFKYRATDERPPPMLFPPPPNSSFLAEQTLRGGYSNSTPPDFRRNDFFQNSIDMREAIHREIEKERIREEIIAAEIARKRVLEAEVRREMMIEREMAMRSRGGGGGGGGGGGFSFFPPLSSSSPAMQFDPRLPRLPQLECGSFEARIGHLLEQRSSWLPIEERVAFQARRENISFEMSPFQRMIEGGAPMPEVNSLMEANKEKMIILAKPDPTLSGGKRKAVTPPALGPSELPSVGSKKLKAEWSCALCQVTATSERALDGHLQGKKHKAKEAGLIAQKTGQNIGIGIFPKKQRKPTKPAETADTSRSVQSKKVGGESLQVLETHNVEASAKKKDELPLQKGQEAEDSKENNVANPEAKEGENPDAEDSMKNDGKVGPGVHSLTKAQNVEDSEKKTDEPTMQKKQKAEDPDKKIVKKKVGVQKKLGQVEKFKLRCNICHTVAYSESGMSGHLEGKKHMARLKAVGYTEADNAKVITQEGNEKVNENAPGLL